MWAAQAAVLRKADATVRNKLTRFDLIYGCLDESAELFALFFLDGSLKILNLRGMFSHEHHKCHIRNSGDPGITDELGIE